MPPATTASARPSPERIEDVDWTAYDFLDLGCSTGGSLRHCMGAFGSERGLGIDLDPRKVQRTREAGYDAVVADARTLDREDAVSYVSMLDFFEHLPDVRTVEEIVAAAARTARDFLYVKHPSFEGQEQAEALGVRQYWWDWHGHTCHLRVADYCAMFERLGLAAYRVRYFEPVHDSTHPSVVPVGLRKDLSAAQAAEFDDVSPTIAFDPPLWRRQDLFVALRAFEPAEWAALTKPTRNDVKVMRAAGQLEAPASGIDRR